MPWLCPLDLVCFRLERMDHVDSKVAGQYIEWCVKRRHRGIPAADIMRLLRLDWSDDANVQHHHREADHHPSHHDVDSRYRRHRNGTVASVKPRNGSAGQPRHHVVQVSRNLSKVKSAIIDFTQGTGCKIICATVLEEHQFALSMSMLDRS